MCQPPSNSSLHQPPRKPLLPLLACRLCRAALLCLLLLLPAGMAAQAQTGETLTPSPLTVAADSGQVVTRTLMLRLPATAADLRFVSQDLANLAGDAVLPASAVQAQLPSLPPPSAAASSAAMPLVAPMTVTLDLARSPAGNFNGQALLLYTAVPAQGNVAQQYELPLALNVVVKQPWPWPFAVLLAGVLLGLGLTFYRDRLRPRDQLLVRLGEVENRIAADKELAGAGRDFLAAAEDAANGALTALRDGNSSQAQQYTAQAEQIVDLWQRQRSNWLMALEKRDQLAQQLPARRDSLFLAAVQNALAAVPQAEISAFLSKESHQANWKSYVDSLLVRLETLRLYAADYVALERSLRRAAVLVSAAALAPQQQAAANRTLEEVKAELNNFNPVAEPAAYSAARDALQARVQAVVAGLPAESTESAKGALAAPAAAAEGDLGSLFVSLIGASLPSLESLQGNRRARIRLLIFIAISWTVALALLAGTGFNELYVQKATFGATPWADYLALLAWGFGAEATRAAITSMVSGWGIPTGSELAI